MHIASLHLRYTVYHCVVGRECHLGETRKFVNRAPLYYSKQTFYECERLPLSSGTWTADTTARYPAVRRPHSNEQQTAAGKRTKQGPCHPTADLQRSTLFDDVPRVMTSRSTQHHRLRKVSVTHVQPIPKCTSTIQQSTYRILPTLHSTLAEHSGTHAAQGGRKEKAVKKGVRKKTHC